MITLPWNIPAGKQNDFYVLNLRTHRYVHWFFKQYPGPGDSIQNQEYV